MSFIKQEWWCQVNETPGKENVMGCLYCGKRITKWDLFKGFFWKLPLRLSEVSQLWEGCCSYHCYGKLIARELGKILGNEIKAKRK